jgi:hypothetical protein
MRHILKQAANAAVKLKGSIFEILYRRLVPRLGHKQTTGAIAHQLCQLIWMILHRAGSVMNNEVRPCAKGRSEYERQQ